MRLDTPPSPTSPRFARRRTSRSIICITVAFAILFSLVVLSRTPLPYTLDTSRDAFVESITDATRGTVASVAESWKSGGVAHSNSNEHINGSYAYATLLGAPSNGDDNMDHDHYFVATRILAYQLLHAPETRSTHNYPFIVVVTADVTEAKRERLRKDGAVVWEAPAIEAGWIQTDVSTWQSCMSKLRLWELTQFDLIAFLDGDTLLTGPLDDVFDDPAIVPQITKKDKANIQADEGALPPKFFIGSNHETSPQHQWPPIRDGVDYPNQNYMNAGFFVMQPSTAMLDYYLSLSKVEGRFDAKMLEQNLLNYAHRREGNMPWVQLDVRWNIHYPTMEDLEGGVRSLHDKWWSPTDERIESWVESWRWRMYGYYEARDALLTAQ